MTITANAERGTPLEHIPVSYSTEDFKIAFNARYLSDVIRNVDTEAASNIKIAWKIVGTRK